MTRIKSPPLWVPDPSWVKTQTKWIQTQLDILGKDQLRKLVQQAVSAINLSYSPYSHYQVGAAILTQSGRFYSGANIERASYSETVHGEESAIINAILDGEMERSGRCFLSALVVAHTSDTAPCGHCRQIMTEHADNCLILVASDKGKLRRVTSLAFLLPYAFTPTDLGIK